MIVILSWTLDIPACSANQPLVLRGPVGTVQTPVIGGSAYGPYYHNSNCSWLILVYAHEVCVAIL